MQLFSSSLAFIYSSPSLEVESDLEVFEMKQEIVSLQTKIENSESEKLTSNAETSLMLPLLC